MTPGYREVSGINGGLAVLDAARVNRPVNLSRENQERLDRAVLSASAAEFGVSEDDITGRSRFQEIVMARRAAAECIKILTAHEQAKIGDLLGGRDRTTMSGLLQWSGESLNTDPFYLATVINITERAIVDFNRGEVEEIFIVDFQESYDDDGMGPRTY